MRPGALFNLQSFSSIIMKRIPSISSKAGKTLSASTGAFGARLLVDQPGFGETTG